MDYVDFTKKTVATAAGFLFGAGAVVLAIDGDARANLVGSGKNVVYSIKDFFNAYPYVEEVIPENSAFDRPVRADAEEQKPVEGEGEGPVEADEQEAAQIDEDIMDPAYPESGCGRCGQCHRAGAPHRGEQPGGGA